MDNLDLSLLFLSLCLLLGLAHGCGYAFERFRMPRVIGEILSGLILGPTVFGTVAPDAFASLTATLDKAGGVFTFLHWLGLVALMFTAGFHVQRKIDRADMRIVVITLLTATSLPFIGGWYAVDLFDFLAHMPSGINETSFRLIMAIAFSVTSIPVISKIFVELRLMETRFARIVLAVATIQDLILWMILSTATETAGGETVDAEGVALHMAKTVIFVAASLWLGPKLLSWATRLRLNLVVKASSTGYLFAVCFLVAAAGGLMEVNLAFGALVAGIVVGAVDAPQYKDSQRTIKDVAFGLFVPLYFALVGLKINLPHHFDLGLTLSFLLASSAVSIACVWGGLIVAREKVSTAFNLGIAMNTRGGPGIVLASVALEAGIVDETMYVTLVMTALITSLGTGAWFRHVKNRGKALIEEAPR